MEPHGRSGPKRGVKLISYMSRSVLPAVFFTIILLSACESDTDPGSTKPKVMLEQVLAPDFNADTAFAYLSKQVAFGPRVPNTREHLACKDWLQAQLHKFAQQVEVQHGKVITYDGSSLDMYNLIASFNPQQKYRIMLSAHWDTRPFADRDSVRRDEPIDGANDGASGVAVLLEIARQLSQGSIGIGVDIMLWDTEDYGDTDTRDSYCLGSQFWAKNSPNYKARYGILLDMVGGKDAIFTMEGNSMKYAPKVVRSVWDVANKIGYSKYFPFEKTPAIIDDHYYINAIKGIPTIDIIQFDRNTESHFFPSWHTHQDNLDGVDKQTLKAVGQTVLTLLYYEDAKQADSKVL